ncbi:cytidine deaminase [Saccharomonospora piscinae]|uniref:cytidine deaminase n=1 Tax=Saccharomonospora piscinae TaxID=687388 RepID=UPI001106BE51|nr:cytidine deaminase [Saccharomonospora piscinae]TLW93119.1 cytidine deaminase [Saccharomonospora piscinae]
MDLGTRLVAAAADLVDSRFPGRDWAGAAAMALDDGTLLTSTAPEVVNPAVELCHEVGALCEAYRIGRPVVASVCVVRADQGRGFWVLSPCGVCQERLRFYGPGVEVAVPEANDPALWRMVTLGELQSHWWATVFDGEPI